MLVSISTQFRYGVRLVNYDDDWLFSFTTALTACFSPAGGLCLFENCVSLLMVN